VSRSRGRCGSLRAGVRADVRLVLDRRGSSGSSASVGVGPADSLAVNGGVNNVANTSLGLTLVGVGVGVSVAASSGGTALGVGGAARGVNSELLQLGGTTEVHGDLGIVSKRVRGFCACRVIMRHA
jgi:hypothetical protein